MSEPITNVLGTVAIKTMGAYDSETIYEKLNVVNYQGSSYCAKQNTQGNLPTNTTYWDLMAEKGDKGDTGEAGNDGYTPVKGTDYYTDADKAELESTLASDVSDEVTDQLSTLTSATPLVASSTAGMTDTTRIYVNSTDGHWYWYDGDSWEDGGVYQATGIADNSITSSMFSSNLNNIISQCRNYIDKNSNLNDYLTPGYYVMLSGTYTNCYRPNNVPVSLLIVERAYTGTSIASSNQNAIVQTIIQRDNINNVYKRSIYGQASNLTFGNWEVQPSKSNTVMPQYYLEPGIDLNDITSVGRYVCTSGSYTNAPTPTLSTFELEVTASYTGPLYNPNYKLYIQKITHVATQDVWIRCISGINSFTYGTWSLISNINIKNYNVLTLGDSILGMPPQDVTNEIARYFSGTVTNCNFGGTTACKRTGSDYEAFSFTELVDSIVADDYTLQDTAISTIESLPDYFDDSLTLLKNVNFSNINVCLIMYGTNDFNANYQIGEITDNNKTTILGSLNYGIKKLAEEYPNIRFIILNPLFRVFNTTTGVNSKTHKNLNNETLNELDIAEIELAENLFIDYIDMRKVGINEYNYGTWLSDGTHLKTASKPYVGRFIAENINY